MSTKKVVIIDPDLKDITPPFIEKRISEITTLRAALTRSDFETLSRIGHTLKGTAGGYGFSELSQYGRQLETMAEKKELSECTKLVQYISDYLDHLEIHYKKTRDE